MHIENTDYREEVMDLKSPYDVKLLRDFLEPMGFDFDENEVDYSVMIFNLNNEVLGVASSQANVLKYIAVAPKYRETAVFAMLITHQLGRLIEKYDKIFAFTRPRNIMIFEGMGFKKIAVAEPLFCVLEYGLIGINDYVTNLKTYKIEKEGADDIASLVVNCNPITNGHLYLIEKASVESDWVYLFVVQENRSAFPFEVRLQLVKEATKHIQNLTIIPGGDYIVSGKTFPHYFLKGVNTTDITTKQAELDVTIFRDYIVPALGIKKRYVGEEMYCQTTAAYNRAMKRLLVPVGVEVIEVERKKNADTKEYISASNIRDAIRRDELEVVKNSLPEATYNYLKSDESAFIREKIKATNTRH
ncbi:[citrate (pro-3S)-lyase] ligase [Balneicella halophila]|uniref:[Citrate [pro-3S]-lyase] ligase n=1 Tax=Balneicella halophila TaxID=1537566 RepID=A0A7L4UMU6_BALHA|nr:[citrate (pro-3S)-lyase] ligase [Balneicella halophila]PVX49405.1 [citrate (pro-3S)-lyase] ligase [Balneicella halophila]